MKLFKKKFHFIFVLLFIIGCAGPGKRSKEAKLHYYSGNKYLKEGNLEKAESEFKTAVSIMPGHVLPHYGLGKVYSKKGQLDRAIEEYEKALKIYPHDPKINYELGQVYDKKSMTEDALIRYKIALLNVKNGGKGDLKQKIRTSLGISYFKKSSYTIALDQLKASLKIEPLSSLPRYYIGMIYRQIGKIDRAIEEYEKAVAMFYLMNKDDKDNKKYFAGVYKEYADALKEKGLGARAEEQLKKYRELGHVIK